MVSLRAPGSRSGLRERKKLAVRRALSSAAIRLAAERGLENVTIEDITAEAGEPLREALVTAMLAHYEGAGEVPDREWLAGLKLVLTAPAIRGEYLKVTSEMQQALAEAIAARTGIDMTQDMYPEMLAGAVTAAAQVAVRRWGAADPPVPLRPLLRRALDQLATACSGGAGRYLTEEEFKALVRPAIFGPNGSLCEPPGKAASPPR